MRRILTIDGGGIRGYFALQILKSVEKHYCGENAKNTLSDHFDLIGGCSTGAIISACLAWGMRVDEVEAMYDKHVKQMFTPRKEYRSKLLYGKYDHRHLQTTLQKIFSEEVTTPDGKVETRDGLLGSERLRTMLLLVLLNADTVSPWPITNNPIAKFNQDFCSDGSPNHERNLDMKLWQLVRASTAAPTYFNVQDIEFDSGRGYRFQDGAISGYNNPSHLAFRMATLPQYGFSWEKGAEKLFLLSVGTGDANSNLEKFRAPVPGTGWMKNVPVFGGALTQTTSDIRHVIESIITLSGIEQDIQCRMMANTRYGHKIDDEIEYVRPIGTAPEPTDQFSYVRYDYQYKKTDEEEGKHFFQLGEMGLEMDNTKAANFLKDIGQRYADGQCTGRWEESLPGVLPSHLM